MSNDKIYILEYLIALTQFSEENKLKDYVEQKLEKLEPKPEVTVEAKGTNYLILRIASTEKNIDACHDKLEFDGEWAIRVKDELGDLLRANAYPILAEIELSLRNFINQKMVDVHGFKWWDFFAPENIHNKVEKIELKSVNHQVKSHHPIEFTFFENLIKIVDHEFQDWPDGRAITTSELSELLTACNSIEDIQKKLDN